jgi:nucleoside-diphosphate kinase|tara:strand:- start:2390 stop:2815 length:426 start_codon:yes stop_codon:yes gene_type:complete
LENQTFAIIKPDAVKNKDTGLIIDRILKAGFHILAGKILHMSLQQAEGFYSVHKGKPFYDELIQFMSSGQCMVLALEKENAVEAWRVTIGATNPDEANAGTIRKDFATNVGLNAVHGSDSNKNAQKEIAFFFSDVELRGNQ